MSVMFKGFDEKFVQFVELIALHLRGTTLLLVMLVIGLGAYTGYKYYVYTKVDPEFCLSCHELESGFKDWQKTKHREITCQRCHTLTIFEKNQLLVSYVVSGKHKSQSQQHGRSKAWDSCEHCHYETLENLKKTKLIDPRSAENHARHLIVAKLTCRECHAYDTHSFEASPESCKKCHSDKVMQKGKCTTECLNCHSYKTTDTIYYTNKFACLKCHKKVTEHTDKYDVLCSKCHLPHLQTKPTESFCLSQCHADRLLCTAHHQNSQKCFKCHRGHK